MTAQADVTIEVTPARPPRPPRSPRRQHQPTSSPRTLFDLHTRPGRALHPPHPRLSLFEPGRSAQHMRNNGSVYGHVFFSRGGNLPNPRSRGHVRRNTVRTVLPLTKYAAVRPPCVRALGPRPPRA